MKTKKININKTPKYAGNKKFEDWRLGIDGPSDSIATKLEEFSGNVVEDVKRIDSSIMNLENKVYEEIVNDLTSLKNSVKNIFLGNYSNTFTPTIIDINTGEEILIEKENTSAADINYRVYINDYGNINIKLLIIPEDNKILLPFNILTNSSAVSSFKQNGKKLTSYDLFENGSNISFVIDPNSSYGPGSGFYLRGPEFSDWPVHILYFKFYKK